MSYIHVSRTETIWSLFGSIVLCALGTQASTLPPDPDNAALLYYQAFLLRPEPDAVEQELVYNNQLGQISTVLGGGELEADANIGERIRELEESLKNREGESNEPNPHGKYDPNFTKSEPYSYEEKTLLQLRERQQMMRGVNPNKKLRGYLSRCRNAINVAQTASEISECDWGIVYSRGRSPSGPQAVEIRHLAFVLRADALLLAAGGDYRAAFERCLMMRRFAGHVGDETEILHSVSNAVDGVALGCIRFLLSGVKLDQKTLTWLKQQLAIQEDSHQSLVKVLNRNLKFTLQILRTNKKTLKLVRDEIGEEAADEAARKKIHSLADEELIALSKAPYADYLSSVIRVIDGEMLYRQKCARIERLTDTLRAEHGSLGVTRMMLMPGPDLLLRWYRLNVRHTADLHALTVAIEILLIHARTGQLPEELPDDLPMDPFTGKLFGYELTDDGFVLICQDEYFQRRGKPLLEFRVRK